MIWRSAGFLFRNQNECLGVADWLRVQAGHGPDKPGHPARLLKPLRYSNLVRYGAGAEQGLLKAQVNDDFPMKDERRADASQRNEMTALS